MEESSRRALIGHTGFVGSNLKSQRSFEGLYNSKNFQELTGTEWDEVICAGVSAVKWKANKEPALDREKIAALESVLSQVRAKRFVLISTIDVYPSRFQQVDEDFDPRSHENHAYGSHRLAFEDFIAETFGEAAYIVRLPGLFGQGLKKNVIYDLLCDNCLEMINLDTSIQWYSLDRLSQDIDVLVEAGVKCTNLMTEPFANRLIQERFFPGKEVGSAASNAVHYDIHTKHAGLFGRDGHYIQSSEDVLSQMEAYINAAKERGTP